MVENLYRKREAFERAAERYIFKLYPEDLEDVLRFYRDLQVKEYSLTRIDKYLCTLVSIKKRLITPFSTATEDDIKRFVVDLNKSDYSDWIKYDQKVVLRIYMSWLGKEETVDWMVIREPKDKRLPEEILFEPEIKAISEAAYTTRDCAFVLALYESGTRIAEFLPIKMKHLNFDRYGAVLRVIGKTGHRRIRLVASSLVLQRWIEEHPAKNNPDAYLWCKIPMSNNPKWKNKHLSYGFVNRLLRELAAKAGIKKKVYPHAFRHARATFLAKHLTEPEMREFFGWAKNSKMPSLYVHLSGRDIDDAVLGVYGFKEAEENQTPVIKVEGCPRCQEPNDPGARFCRKCGMPFGKSAQNMDRAEELIIDFLKLISEEFPGVKSKFREVVNRKGMGEIFL